MIGMAELEEAIDRVLAGPAKRSRIINDREKKYLPITNWAMRLSA